MVKSCIVRDSLVYFELLVLNSQIFTPIDTFIPSFIV